MSLCFSRWPLLALQQLDQESCCKVQVVFPDRTLLLEPVQAPLPRNLHSGPAALLDQVFQISFLVLDTGQADRGGIHQEELRKYRMQVLHIIAAFRLSV